MINCTNLPFPCETFFQEESLIFRCLRDCFLSSLVSRKSAEMVCLAVKVAQRLLFLESFLSSSAFCLPDTFPIKVEQRERNVTWKQMARFALAILLRMLFWFPFVCVCAFSFQNGPWVIFLASLSTHISSTNTHTHLVCQCIAVKPCKASEHCPEKSVGRSVCSCPDTKTTQWPTITTSTAAG